MAVQAYEAPVSCRQPLPYLQWSPQEQVAYPYPALPTVLELVADELVAEGLQQGHPLLAEFCFHEVLSALADALVVEVQQEDY